MGGSCVAEYHGGAEKRETYHFQKTGLTRERRKVTASLAKMAKCLPQRQNTTADDLLGCIKHPLRDKRNAVKLKYHA